MLLDVIVVCDGLIAEFGAFTDVDALMVIWFRCFSLLCRLCLVAGGVASV